MKMLSYELNFAQVLCLGAFLSAVAAQSQVETNPDGQSGSLKFSVPDLSDDETHSPWVPDQMKCDACQAVSFQLWNHFDMYNKKHKSRKYNLLESDIMEITDALCTNTDVFNTYGVKEVDKVHRLSGAGVDGADKPGVIAGGGKWPGRLRDMCDQFMGRVGEEKIYAVYKKDPNDPKRLTNFLCRGPAKTVRGECTKVQEAVYDGNDSPIHGAKPFRAQDDDDEDYDEDEDGGKDEL